MINNVTLTLDTYVGNNQAKSIIRDTIAVCKKKHTNFPFTLIHGPSGMGKSSLAKAIATDMKNHVIHIACGGSNWKDILKAMVRAPLNTILILDEIHSIPAALVESRLYQFMDSNTLNIYYPDGTYDIRNMTNNLTIIGCTTDPDKLLDAFINRFTLNIRLKPYTHDEMKSILRLNIAIPIDDDAINILANSTKYNPREAVQISNMANNYASLHDILRFDMPRIIDMLQLNEIDINGFNDSDRIYLHTLYNVFTNEPTGLNALSGMMQMSSRTITTIEDHFIKQGLLKRTPRGRVLTMAGEDIAKTITL